MTSPNTKMINNKSKIRSGFVLPLVIVVVIILSILATGLLFAGYLVRINSVRAKCETDAMLAAEAGYEQGIFWMSKQSDLLGALQGGANEGTIEFGSSSCDFTVDFDDFIGARPVYRITATGRSGNYSRVVDVHVVQEITGWVMGKCRIPTGPTSTTEVYFANGEILDIPIHINNLKDNPDQRDIYIQSGAQPRFLQKVEMGESRRTAGGTDKYSTVMNLFEDGIYFDQPNVRITDEASVQSKVNRFRDSTDPLFRFTPSGAADVANPQEAVQLEFFVEDGVGKVRITNNCTVLGYLRNSSTRDYKITPGSNPQTYQKYYVYAYHYAPRNETPIVRTIEETYVTQTFGTKESEPGGQIFVDGNVIIGSDAFDQMTVKGKMTVVATGNIWLGDSIVVDGPHDPATGLPTNENPNVLGLIAQGVVKVVDPGFSEYMAGTSNYYPGPAPPSVEDSVLLAAKMHDYKPIGNGAGTNRILPHTMVVEAAVTVGGGGWGAENVRVSSSYGGRKEAGPGPQDFLILRGTISESVRGVVGQIDRDGYLKQYYLDRRLLAGILPGDIWFGGKYVPAPAGWHDYRPEN